MLGVRCAQNTVRPSAESFLIYSGSTAVGNFEIGSSENLITVARQTTYLAIVAMGQMLALLTGGSDHVSRQDRCNHISDYRADHGAA